MKKKIYRITEGDLHNMIKNATMKIIREMNDFDNHEIINSNWSENDNSVYDDNMQKKQDTKELNDRHDFGYTEDLNNE